MALPPLVVELLMNNKEFVAGMKEADASLTKLGNHSGLAKFNAMGKQTLKLASGLAVGIGGESLKMAADFQKQTELLVTAGGESQKALKSVSDGILKIARDTGTSTEQLTEGMYTVEKAGIRGANGLKVLKAAAQGAKAENVDLGTMTNALTSILRSYDLPASKAVKVTNELVAASGASKTSMQEFAGSLSTVLPIASAAHLSFAQVGGAIATLTSHGTSAQEATQELANTIRNLQAPNNVAVNEMAQLGLNSNDVSQKLGQRGLTGTINLLSETVLKKMGPAGTVLLNGFNQSKIAAQDAATMFAKLPASAQKLASSYEAGKISLGDYRKALKALPADQAALAQQWVTTENKAKGFTQQLRTGGQSAQTYTAAMKQIMGGATGLNTALMLTGGSAATFSRNVKDISAAGQKTGKDVSSWAQTQKLFNVQLDRAKQYVETYAIELGTALIPYVQKAGHYIGDLIGYFQKHSTEAKILAGIVGGVLAASMLSYVATALKARAATIGWGGSISAIVLLVTHWKQAMQWFDKLPTYQKWLVGFGAALAGVQLTLSTMRKGAGAIDGIAGVFGTLGKKSTETEAAVGGLAGKVPTLGRALKDIPGLLTGMGSAMGADGLAATALGGGFVAAAGALAYFGFKLATAKTQNEVYYESLQKQYKATGNNVSGYARLQRAVESTKKQAQTLSNVYGQELQYSTQGAGQASAQLTNRLAQTKIQLSEATYAAQKNQEKFNTLSGNANRLAHALGVTKAQALGLADKFKVDLSNSADVTGKKWDNLVSKSRNLLNQVKLSHNPMAQLKNDVLLAGDGMQTAQQQATNMADAMNHLAGDALNAAQANLGFKSQLSSLTTQLKTTHGQLNINTAAGLQNQQAIADAGNAALQAAQAYQQQGHTSQQTAKYLEGLETQLERTLVKQTGNKTAVDNLLKSLGLLPGQASAAFGALDKHASTSKGVLDNLTSRTYTIKIDATGQNTTGISRTSGPIATPGHAAGGLVRGAAGDGTTDSKVIRVSGNEYVHTADTVKREGVGAMDALNSGLATIVPMFAAGGSIRVSETDNISSITKGINSWLQGVAKKYVESSGAINYKPSAGVAQWAPLILKALQMMGQPSSLLGTVERRMNQESGGNPNAINLTDSNAQAGDPSRGLMQTIMSTFRAYHYPGTSTNIYDPLANILASMRYALSRYGSLASAYNRSGGYDSGGWLLPGVTAAVNKTGKPEAVLTGDQWASIKSLIKQLSPNQASWGKLTQIFDHLMAHIDQVSNKGGARDRLTALAEEQFKHSRHLEQTQQRSKQIGTFDYAKTDLHRITGTTSLASINAIMGSITQKIDHLQNSPERTALERQAAAANKRFGVLANERLQAAQKIQSANEMIANVRSNVMQSASITGLDLTNQVGGRAGHPGSNLIHQLQQKRDAIVRFSANLKTLAKRGLSRGMLTDLMNAGPDQAAAMAQQLVQMKLPDLKELNSLESQIYQAGSTLGVQSVNLEMGGNINRNYMAVLDRQQASVEKSITKLAHSFVVELGKGLHIKTYDTGGWLMPGVSTVHNGLGVPEAIMPTDLMAQTIRREVGGGGTSVVVMPDIYLDGRKVYEGVRAHAINEERKNGTNGLSRKR